MEPDYLFPKSRWEPVNFDDHATNIKRPRAGIQSVHVCTRARYMFIVATYAQTLPYIIL